MGRFDLVRDEQEIERGWLAGPMGTGVLVAGILLFLWWLAWDDLEAMRITRLSQESPSFNYLLTFSGLTVSMADELSQGLNTTDSNARLRHYQAIDRTYSEMLRVQPSLGYRERHDHWITEASKCHLYVTRYVNRSFGASLPVTQQQESDCVNAMSFLVRDISHRLAAEQR